MNKLKKCVKKLCVMLSLFFLKKYYSDKFYVKIIKFSQGFKIFDNYFSFCQ